MYVLTLRRYGDELLPLQQSGISANMCVIIDKGPAPSMAKVKLQFLVCSDGKRSADTYVVDVERTWDLAKWCVNLCHQSLIRGAVRRLCAST